MSNNNEIVTDYTNYTVNLFGNRFFGCQKALYYRVASNEGDVRDAKLNINQNRFIGMHQSATKKSLYFQFDIFDTSDIKATSKNWDFSHNYYDSDTVDNDHHPDNYVYTSYTYNSTVYDCIDRSLFFPYYTDAAMTKLSDGTPPTQTGITVSETTHEVDGEPHSIKVNVPTGAVVSYSLDGSLNEQDRAWQSNAPTLTLPGTQTIYYMVERTGYQNYYGSATLTILAAERELVFENQTVSYNGEMHTLSFAPLEGDKVTYTYQGKNYSSCPQFSEIGNYEIGLSVTNAIYGTKTATATLTINKGVLKSVALTGMQVIYDGKAYSPVVTKMLGTEQVTFSVDGGPYTEELPALSEVGTYNIMAKFTADKYLAAYRTATITILPRQEREVTVSGYAGPYDGQPHGITVSDIGENDTVTYSTDGLTFTEECPTFTEVGRHTVTVKVSRPDYSDLLIPAEVNISEEPVLFRIDLTFREKADCTHTTEFHMTLLPSPVWDSEDIIILEYGLRKGTRETLVRSSATGLTTLPPTVTVSTEEDNTCMFVRYRCGGEVKEVTSVIY